VSTADDYLRFAQMLANGGTLDGTRILSEASVKAMISVHTPPGLTVTFFPGTAYGLGLGVIAEPTGASAPFSKGSFHWGGARGTWFWVDPARQLVVVGMVQRVQAANNPDPMASYMMGNSGAAIYPALVDG
jgi:CubicO group peptidase (beta-lactamase class C family)